MECALKQARMKRGMTQAETAQALKVSTRRYQYIETGVGDPTLAQAFLLSTLFNTPIEILFQYIKERGKRERR